MEKLLETIKGSSTVWARSEDDVIFHLTRGDQFGSWDGMTDEELGLLLCSRYAKYIWTFSAAVAGRYDVLGAMDTEHRHREVVVPNEVLMAIRFKYGTHAQTTTMERVHCPPNPGMVLYAVCQSCEDKKFYAALTDPEQRLDDVHATLIHLPKMPYLFLGELNTGPRPADIYLGRCDSCKTIYWTQKGETK